MRVQPQYVHNSSVCGEPHVECFRSKHECEEYFTHFDLKMGKTRKIFYVAHDKEYLVKWLTTIHKCPF